MALLRATGSTFFWLACWHSLMEDLTQTSEEERDEEEDEGIIDQIKQLVK